MQYRRRIIYSAQQKLNILTDIFHLKSSNSSTSFFEFRISKPMTPSMTKKLKTNKGNDASNNPIELLNNVSTMNPSRTNIVNKNNTVKATIAIFFFSKNKIASITPKSDRTNVRSIHDGILAQPAGLPNIPSTNGTATSNDVFSNNTPYNLCRGKLFFRKCTFSSSLRLKMA